LFATGKPRAASAHKNHGTRADAPASDATDLAEKGTFVLAIPRF